MSFSLGQTIENCPLNMGVYKRVSVERGSTELLTFEREKLICLSSVSEARVKATCVFGLKTRDWINHSC